MQPQERKWAAATVAWTDADEGWTKECREDFSEADDFINRPGLCHQRG